MTVISRTEISAPAGLSRIGSKYIHKAKSIELGNYSRVILLKVFIFLVFSMVNNITSFIAEGAHFAGFPFVLSCKMASP